MSKNGSKRSFIDSVEVKSPCNENWDDMKGNDRVRFCSHCAKDVNNLSEMSRKAATRLVRASDGNLCIRYRIDPGTRRPVFAEQLLQITRRTPRLTAGVMSASLALSARGFAQENIPVDIVPSAVQEQPAEKPAKADPEKKPSTRLTGTVFDPNGAVIPNVQIVLKAMDTGTLQSTTSDSDGRYAFAAVPGGRYELTAEGKNGFATKRVEGLEFYDGHEASVDVTQEPEAMMFLGGAMAVVEYSSPLASAIADENVELVRELLTQGESPNAKEDEYNRITPLFVAVETANLEIIQLLLDFGAKVNIRDDEKRTPPMQLDSDATPELVEMLVRHGGKVNLTDKENNTALIAAIENGAETPVVAALIRAGADVRVVNKSGRTALMEAADRDDFEIVKLLVEAGADVNARDEDGDTAYDMTGDAEIEQFLIGNGAIVTAKTDSPASPDQ